MLEPVASLLALAYDLLGSYAAAIVLPSATFALVVSALNGRRQLRHGRTVVALEPRLRAVSRQLEHDPSARFKEVNRLLHEHGVKGGAGCLIVVVNLVLLLVLYHVVTGLGTLDGTNGGGPRYVEEGTALWEDVRSDGGELRSFGVDLAERYPLSDPISGDALPYVGLGGLLALAMHVSQRLAAAAPGTRVLQGVTRPRRPLAGVVARLVAAAALVVALPAGLVVHLITILAVGTGVAGVVALRLRREQVPVRSVRQHAPVPGSARSRTARPPQPAPGRQNRFDAFMAASADADDLLARDDPGGSLSLRSAATREFIARGGPKQLQRAKEQVETNLSVIVAARPSEGPQPGGHHPAGEPAVGRGPNAPPPVAVAARPHLVLVPRYPPRR